FYWNNSSSNSLFGNSKDNGHIELAKDWVFADGYDGTTSGEYDNDPKVSGKIKIEGIAQDEGVLREIKVQFDKAMGGLGTTNTTIATYNNGTWTCASSLTNGAIPTGDEDEPVGWAAEVSQATYADLLAAGIITALPANVEATNRVPETSQDYGHVVHWILYLDTAYVADVASTDVIVTATAKDKGKPTWTGSAVEWGTNTTTVTGTPQGGGDAPFSGVVTKSGDTPSETNPTIGAYTGRYRMDVVPYIKSVTTSLSTVNKKNPTVYSRTALGHYPVRDDETVTLYGFNLFNADGTTKAAITDATYNSHGTDNTNGNYISVTIPSLSSGNVVLTVSDIEMLNNKNNNDSKGSYTGTYSADNYAVCAYNRQPNGDNNNLLTDDVVFDVWQFDNTHVVPISGKIEQPVMKINPNNDKVGFAFVNGPLYFSMGGGTGKQNYSYTYWMGSYDFFTSVGFTYDKLGFSYGVAAGGDINSNSADKFQLMTSRWGNASREQNGSYASSNSLRLESIGQKGDAAGNNTGTNYFDKQRFQSPSLTTSVHRRNNTNYTYLYMAYYDQLNDEIRFRYGYTSSTRTENFQAFRDTETAGAPYTYANSASSDVQMVTGSNTGRNSGSYVSIGVVSANGTITNATNVDDVVVLVWYDATDRCLRYTYNESPVTNRQGNKTATGWSTPVRVFNDKSDMANAGEYCKVAVDNDGGVHIACYDPVNLDLNYAYLPSSFGGKATETANFNTCVVDSNGVTGSNITLDVAKVGNDWIPYIGYYITSAIRPKLAYRVDTSTYAPAGSDNDEFTMAWESTIIPTSKTVQMQSNQHNDINVGVWKNKDTGVIKTTYTTGTNSNTNEPNGYYTGDKSCGQIYGNGKKDANGNAYPILGYAVKIGAASDAIETAQMK
ncbi:MAG: hypothetical protein K6G09_06125, partial [Treponema sp.]|nr:hypothetical protein [Treponema sp.]